MLIPIVNPCQPTLSPVCLIVHHIPKPPEHCLLCALSALLAALHVDSLRKYLTAIHALNVQLLVLHGLVCLAHVTLAEQVLRTPNAVFQECVCTTILNALAS